MNTEIYKTSQHNIYPVSGNTGTINSGKYKLSLIAVLISGLLIGCESDDKNSLSSANNPSLNMAIPESLTGGQTATASKSASIFADKNTITSLSRTFKQAKSGTGQPCAYIGNEDEDEPFKNGYETSKFMISTMATWTCIADLLIDVSEFVPHNGQIIETDNDNNAANFEADKPTHYSVTDDTSSQVTVQLYYNYTRSQPPVIGEQAQFYISWNEADNGDVEGRMIIDVIGVEWEDHDAEDPSMMRMDFNFTEIQQNADTFLQFNDSNPWADGFRIQISKDLEANPLLKVFEARGLINMKAQFSPTSNITEIPDVHLVTVSDALGNGASIAEFQNLSFPFVLNANLGNNLGDYLFTKKDVYYFEDDMDWDYINKTITTSEYRGNRTTALTGGSWLFPFNPSLDLIITGLSLDNDYFTGTKCNNIGDDCTALANAVHYYAGGFGDQEENQGSDPLDWRSTELQNAEYLDTVYPNGVDWSGAFDHSFTPSTP